MCTYDVNDQFQLFVYIYSMKLYIIFFRVINALSFLLYYSFYFIYFNTYFVLIFFNSSLSILCGNLLRNIFTSLFSKSPHLIILIMDKSSRSLGMKLFMKVWQRGHVPVFFLMLCIMQSSQKMCEHGLRIVVLTIISQHILHFLSSTSSFQSIM